MLILNALTIVTEFIGVSLALGFLGCPKIIAIPTAAVLLFAVVAGGSFRRWEGLMFLLIAVNVVIIPMVVLVHPTLTGTADGLVPMFRGGLNSTVLLLIVALVGTTVAPCRLFFQQSNVVDKRITTRWIPYARHEPIWSYILGLVTQGVQVLAGILLPSATVFLVLLCNDRAVLGPWSNTLRQNVVTWTIVWSLVLVSLALTATTLFPRLSMTTIGSGLATGAVIGLIGGIGAILAGKRHTDLREAEAAETFVQTLGGGLDPEEIDELDDAALLTRTERRAVREQDRVKWCTPNLASLGRPIMSPVRRAGLVTLRCYLVVAVVLVVVKIVEVGLG